MSESGPQPPGAADPPGWDPLVRLLADRGSERRLRRSQVLFSAGEAGGELFIIRSGRLRAYAGNTRGKEVTFGTYGPGEFVGEMSLIGDSPRSADVEAVEATVCSRIPRAEVRAFIAEHPDFAFTLLAAVCERARRVTMHARLFVLEDSYGRLRHCLYELAGPARADGTRWIEHLPTQAALAESIGCTREMVARLMRELRGHFVERRGEGLLIRRELPLMR